MININKLVRPNIVDLNPYSSARDEYTGKADIFLDANENPFGTLNRYPDPKQVDIKQKLARLKGIETSNIFIGNGSDEVIDLAFRIFCTPGEDRALTFTPTYGMYGVSAAINDVELIKVPLNNTFQIDLNKLKIPLEDKSLKLIFICSPNNPTGNLIKIKDIEYILQRFKGIVIVDEAYIDFSEGDSMVSKIKKYNNLIVSQTFSKAWGLAAVRVGTAYTNPDIINLFNKVKPPYNISQLNQEAIISSLNKQEQYHKNLDAIRNEKERILLALEQIEVVKKVYPSDANFYLIEVENADQIYSELLEQSIITRNRNKAIKNCIRVTIGTATENNKLINALKSMK